MIDDSDDNLILRLGDYTLRANYARKVTTSRIMEILCDALSAEGWEVTLVRASEEKIR